MPRDTGTRRTLRALVLAGMTLPLLGCNSSQNNSTDGMYAQYFRLIRRSFAAGFGKQLAGKKGQEFAMSPKDIAQFIPHR